MRRGFEEQARAAAFRHHGWTGIAAFEHALRCFEDEPGLRGGPVVAGEAIVFQNGHDVLLEIHRSRAFDLRYGNRFGWVFRGFGFVRANGLEALEHQDKSGGRAQTRGGRDSTRRRTGIGFRAHGEVRSPGPPGWRSPQNHFFSSGFTWKVIGAE